jgi:hypothetical protein
MYYFILQYIKRRKLLSLIVRMFYTVDRKCFGSSTVDYVYVNVVFCLLVFREICIINSGQKQRFRVKHCAIKHFHMHICRIGLKDAWVRRHFMRKCIV